MFFQSCVRYALIHVCLNVPCGHLLGEDWPLGSRLWCLAVRLLLCHWYPGSGKVLDCIDSRSLHPYLLRKHLQNLCTSLTFNSDLKYLKCCQIRSLFCLLFLLNKTRHGVIVFKSATSKSLVSVSTCKVTKHLGRSEKNVSLTTMKMILIIIDRHLGRS